MARSSDWVVASRRSFGVSSGSPVYRERMSSQAFPPRKLRCRGWRGVPRPLAGRIRSGGSVKFERPRAAAPVPPSAHSRLRARATRVEYRPVRIIRREVVPPARVPRWSRRPDERPQELLDTALEIFSTRGYRATRLEQVAEAAGVTKGAIYYYFSTKEELLTQAL